MALNNQKVLSKDTASPHPFNGNEHHTRFRRDVERNCGDGKIRYILFLLDTSGSIGEDTFTTVKTLLASLIPFFCKPVKVAVMTFNHEYKLEFCFDCFDNDCNGRKETKQAIKAIQYRGGLTYTGGATQCACDVLLDGDCGLPSDASCIDVVYITDGRSNDPQLRVCDRVQCLHNRKVVNTYAIGIGNVNQAELDCIANVSSDSRIFRYQDFDEFGMNIFLVAMLLTEELVDIDATRHEYACVNSQNSEDRRDRNDLENKSVCNLTDLDSMLNLL